MAEEVAVEVEYQYFTWPLQIVSGWLFLQGVFSLIVLGIYAQFVGFQHYLGRQVPWYFSMSLAVAVITIVFLIVMLILFNIRLLTPFYMVTFATIGFILTLVALIGTALGLFANQNNAANNYCNAYGINYAPIQTQTVVYGNGGYSTVPATSTGVLVLAGEHNVSQYFWNQLCSEWKAAFAFQLLTILLFLYMIYLSFDVLQRNRKAITVEEAETEV